MIRVIFIISIVITFAKATIAQCPDDLICFNQSNIDQFLIDYPDCTEISGALILTGDNIEDLSPLSQIETVGSLILSGCGSLLNLDGLQSIQHINEVELFDNASLQDISAISNISDSLNEISVEQNAVLRYIDGFDNVLSMKQINITNNPSLERIVGWDSMNTCEDEIFIKDNLTLDEIRGFNSLQETLGVEILRNRGVDVFGFDQTETSYITIESVDSLIGFNQNYGNGGAIRIDTAHFVNAFNNYSSLVSFEIDYISSSGSLKTLRNAEQCSSNITIGDIYTEDITPFERLESVGQALTVSYCSFTDLNFLPRIESIRRNNGNASVCLITNSNLADISALENILADSISKLAIVECPKLSICNNKFVCSVLESNSAQIFVKDNLPGCNSAEEILATCPEDEAEDPMDMCPFMAPRPGMQINRMSEVEYEILYTFMDKEMYIRNISYTEVLDMIEHHKISKDVLFDAERFSFNRYCEQAEGIAHRTQTYEYTIPQEPLMELKSQQAISEIDYFRNFAWQIQPGECVKL